MNADAPERTARLYDARGRPDQCFCTDRRATAPRPPDPERRLADFDKEPTDDGDEPPRRREDEDGEENCREKRYATGTRPGT
jgi:hypothetical protein